jgi:hypothetical protein
MFIFIVFAHAESAYAETVDNSNQLDVALTADNQFNAYLSTSDNEKGEFLLSGTSLDKVYQCDTQLAIDKKYYLHIEVLGDYASNAFIGKFVLNGNGFTFKNGSRTLTSNLNDIKVSKTGFGLNYETPTLCALNYNPISSAESTLSPAKWIWTNYGNDVNCTRYFSAEIIPVPLVTATGAAMSVNLLWDHTSDAVSYNVKRSATEGGPYTTITSNLTLTSYKDTDVVNGTTYYYIVTAVDKDGNSVNSYEVSATPKASVSILKVVLEADEQLQLSVHKELIKNAKMTWISSDSTVATVDNNGVVTALKPGNTIITVTNKLKTYTDTINVLVVDDASELRLAVDLKVGTSARLTVDDLTNTVNATWTSMNPTVAIVTNTGKVEAVSEGLVLITAKNDQGNNIGQVYIRVRQ